MTRARLYNQPKTDLFYEGDEDYRVEIGDEVEFLGDGQFGPATHAGEITAIYSRKASVKVAYRDETDWTVAGEQKRKVATVPAKILCLIARVM